jgi:hypothetical protein
MCVSRGPGLRARAEITAVELGPDPAAIGVMLLFGGSGDPIRNYYIGGTQVAFEALEAMRRQLAVKLGPHGIRTVTIKTVGMDHQQLVAGIDLQPLLEGQLADEGDVIFGEPLAGEADLLLVAAVDQVLVGIAHSARRRASAAVRAPRPGAARAAPGRRRRTGRPA